MLRKLQVSKCQEIVTKINVQNETGKSILPCHQSDSLDRDCISISSGQWNSMKTYHNEGNTDIITKIASKKKLEFFGQSR